MHLHIFTLGKIKSVEIENLFNYYLTLSNNKTKLVKVNHKVLQDKTPNSKVDLQELISKYEFPKKLFIMTEYGTEYTTEGFVNKLNNLQNHESEIGFLIGNAFGWFVPIEKEETPLKAERGFKNIKFQDSNENNIDYRFISLSQMTFSHEIASLLLAEQIYRFADGLVGGKYGK